jgi:ribonuclease P protein component
MRRSDEFAAVFRRGRRAGRGPLVVHLLLPSETSPPTARAGFVVGRGVGPAVTRNQVRRRLRHVIRHRLSRLPAGSSLVIRALPGAADLSFHELSANVDNALGRLTAPPSGLTR